MDEYLESGAGKSASSDDAQAGGVLPHQIPPGACSELDVDAAPRSVAGGRELRMVANPQWTRLNDELQSLRARRAQLAANRTPLHPEIQDLDRQIAQAEEKLAATRRQIVDQTANLPAVVNGPISRSVLKRQAESGENRVAARPAAQSAEARETYRKLNDALVRANTAVARAEAAESQARQEQAQLPLIEVIDAKAAPASLPQFRALIEPLRLSLAAGLAMAVGIWLLLRGLPAARTFATTAQVQNALSVPVVGVLREAGVAAAGGGSVVHAFASLLYMVLGMAVLGVCGLVFTGQIDHAASYVPWNLHAVTDPLHRFVDILSQKP
jgi:uncharacterized membrane protein YccC